METNEAEEDPDGGTDSAGALPDGPAGGTWFSCVAGRLVLGEEEAGEVGMPGLGQSRLSHP
ncbi:MULTISPECIES: hypothetical protein [Ralstonia]|uniref:hypothetical protein n=1 Tax=Ralstonia TaxID=48736 RepID=UPI0005D83223|nr:MULTISPECIES: hypothetical protein [Ralstonia]AJW45744.1 hypothetical protein TK49_14185 [Ralstonia mannitolilytica]MBU9578168.1 hypothetical protein [Ralstonia mannitolilytica]PLT19636.1 hypothetical protein CXP34_06705 [Ralstonia mannitolilytica]QIF07918.1 hypothetical protein G5A69_09780 [Ralstonia mannitolilytica]